MPEFITVANTGEIAPGYIKLVEVDGHAIALCNADGTFYALDDICTHEHKSISDGEIEDDVITCISHGSQFNLKTGAVERGPANKPLPTYQVMVQGDEVKIARPT